MYPVFFDIEGRHCLVVGGGKVAERKIRGLLDEGALVTVISPKISENIKKMKKSRTFGKKLTVLSQNYAKGIIKGTQKDSQKGTQKDSKNDFFMVFSATNSKKTNELVFKEADALGIPVNVADKPELCSFYLPARVKRGSFQLAISTSGKAPFLAKTVREMLAEDIPEEFGLFVDILGAVRYKLLKKNGKNVKKKVGKKELAKGYNALVNSSLLELVVEASRKKVTKSPQSAKRRINTLLTSQFGKGFTLSALKIKL